MTGPDKLPRTITVRKVVSCRYAPGDRPVSWDDRRAGVEVVETEDGETLHLFSQGGQSSPAPGWRLLVQREVVPAEEQLQPDAKAFSWTLHGISPGAPTPRLC